MSRTKTKFFIVAIDLEFFKYHVLELYRPQANKILKGCDNSLMKLMTFLEFRFGTLCIKDMELLLQYQLYMTPEMINQKSQQDLEVQEKKQILNRQQSKMKSKERSVSRSPR